LGGLCAAFREEVGPVGGVRGCDYFPSLCGRQFYTALLTIIEPGYRELHLVDFVIYRGFSVAFVFFSAFTLYALLRRETRDWFRFARGLRRDYKAQRQAAPK
jgi:hypothetical protein